MVGPERGERWGIFGGIFDPVHWGHLRLAQDILSTIALDGILFVPSLSPPHRLTQPAVDYAQRAMMVELAIRHTPRFILSTAERDMDLPGYTLNVVRHLKSRHPGVDFLFVVGADNLRKFTSWYHWEDILVEVVLLAGTRPGASLDIDPLLPRDRVISIETGYWEISSTAVRGLVASGAKEETLCQVVPAEVANYIMTHGLYR